MIAAPMTALKTAAGGSAAPEAIAMTEAATNSADRTASKLLYECHLALLAFNAFATSIVELATNCSIGALSITVAFPSELVGSS